jgi:peptidoglycan/xylan/chitin deacetylase (PgdA/CDA1 family)
MLRRLLRRFEARQIVLLYHRVTHISSDPWSLAVTPEHFAEHLEVLRAFRRVRLEHLLSGGIGRSGLTFAITFDDGYADNLYEVRRLLARFDTPATFFIATGWIGERREFWWDELERIVARLHPGEAFERVHEQLYARLRPLSHAARRAALDRMLAESGENAQARPTHQILTAAELQRLASDDLVEIGAHTVTHPQLSSQPIESQRAELRESKRWLEDLLGRRVSSFSYPFGGTGDYSPQTVDAVRDAGFTRACTTTSRSISRFDDVLQWGRVNVTDMDGDAFGKLLSSVA